MAFLDYASHLGADLIATGHYVRRAEIDGKVCLLKGLITTRTRAIFCVRSMNKQLARSLFPVGELQKSEVRALAAKHGLVTHDKKDSTGICFYR